MGNMFLCVLVCSYVPAVWLFVNTSVKILYLLFVCARPIVYRCMEICIHSHYDTQTSASLVCVQYFYYFQIVSYHGRTAESSQDAIRVFSMILPVRMRGKSILSGIHVYGTYMGAGQRTHEGYELGA